MRILFVLSLFFLSGCGTLLSLDHIGYQNISINSNVEQPDVYINGNYVNPHQGVFKIKKSDNGAFVKISKEGYKTSQIYLQRDLRPVVMVLDALLIIPFIIDIINDEIYEFNPSNLTIFLTKEVN